MCPTIRLQLEAMLPHEQPLPKTPKSSSPVATKPQQPKPPLVTSRIDPQTISMTDFRLPYDEGMTTYHLTPRAPMDKRDMASIWRKLRRAQYEGLSEELDVQATTDALAQTGFLFQPTIPIPAT